MQQITTVTVNCKGGIVSPGYLKDVLEAATAALVTHVRFGLRQQLMMNILTKKLDIFERLCSDKHIVFEQGKVIHPNIVSSYSVARIFTTGTWLSEGVYNDVFDLFTYTPKLKINICDSKQSFVPLFTGHINLLSSSFMHYWWLYLRFPQSNTVYCWPELIYTNDIAHVSEQLEKIILEESCLYMIDGVADGDLLYHSFKSKGIQYSSKPIEEPFSSPDFYLPYYEGFNLVNNQYWLGIYRRDELFPVEFLKELCTVCLETKIGQFYTTPWKSIVINGIEKAHRKQWDRILGKYRINVRHAANELNWQVENNNEDGVIIKRHVIRYFDKEDVRTYGLSFAVKTNPLSVLFGSVIIARQQNRSASQLKSMDRFDVFYTRNFNPNSTELILFRGDIEKENLGVYLVSLCKYYYEQAGDKLLLADTLKVPSTEVAVNDKTVYQCKHCLTVYDEVAGEPEKEIAINTAFKDLPGSYCCPMCEADKTAFVEIKETSLMKAVT